MQNPLVLPSSHHGYRSEPLTPEDGRLLFWFLFGGWRHSLMVEEEEEEVEEVEVVEEEGVEVLELTFVSSRVTVSCV